MVKVLIDPFLTGNELATAKPEDFKPDVIAVTHGHGDHLGDTIEISKSTGALVVSNFEIVTYVQNNGVENAHPLHIGGGRSFEWGRIKLTIAHHGSALPDGSYGGVACGLLLDLGGTKVYHAGDTSLFYDMKLIGEEVLDLALLPIGDNFTMGPDDALKAVRLLKPRAVVPMHYNTFDVIQQDPDEWARRVEKETDTKAHVLKPGASVTVG
jgi:L-ascorbate metabolism protein UlaG (beta-lactamase superfamily)